MDRSPGQRYRFEQYLPDLEAAGWEWELSNLLDEAMDRTLYSPGNYSGKARIAMHSRKVRKQDVARLQQFDLVVVYREALLTRSTFFEQAVHAAGIPLIVDFDDAIWIRDMHRSNRWLRGLKDPGKLRKLLGWTTAATAGNAYLADFARQYTKTVHVVPSTVDTEVITPTPKSGEGPLVIGWMGSPTTLAHLEDIYPALTALQAKWGDRIAFEFVGAEAGEPAPPRTTFLPWSASEENALLGRFDLGLMPLPETPWAAGKCGMKLLLYMAAGLPVVASPVGINTQLVPGHGLLANTAQEWVAALDTLLQEDETRRAFGSAGRAFVEQEYARKRWADDVVNIYARAIHKSQ